MQNSGMMCKKHRVLKVDLTEQEKQKVEQEEAQGKISISKILLCDFAKPCTKPEV